MSEIERLRMQVAICGVLASSDTPSTLAKNRNIHPDFDCASVQDCIRAAERQIALRKQLEQRNKVLIEIKEIQCQQFTLAAKESNDQTNN